MLGFGIQGQTTIKSVVQELRADLVIQHILGLESVVTPITAQVPQLLLPP